MRLMHNGAADSAGSFSAFREREQAEFVVRGDFTWLEYGLAS